MRCVTSRTPAPGTAAAWPAKDWYHGFGSAELEGLIAQAASSNLDLGAARARLLQADARSRQAGAALLPSVDAVGNANYLAGHSADGSAHELDWSTLLSTSYEVDFWGKNHATLEAAKATALASRYDQQVVALATVSSVAATYFQALSLRDRIKVAEDNVAAAEQTLDGIRVQIHARDGEVSIFTRSLDDITDRLPELVEIARALPVRSVILDGEAIALGPDGRPLPFQATASRAARSA